MVSESYGYATFTNIGVNLVFFSAEGGKALAHNKNTYMNMASGGEGPKYPTCWSNFHKITIINLVSLFSKKILNIQLFSS